LGHYLSEIDKTEEEERAEAFEELKEKQLLEALQRGIEKGELVKILAQIINSTSYPRMSREIFIKWYGEK
jgi:hypothetical protein